MAQSVLGKINYLTDAQYKKAKEEGNIDPNQIYLTPDDSDIKDYVKLDVGVVTTLPSGSNATAEITGTTTNPILNLGIPTGPSGSNYVLTDEDKSEIASLVDVPKEAYSTSETVIGEYLGKTLYRKVLSFKPTAQNTRYFHHISNLDRIVRASGRYTRTGDGLQQLIPGTYSNWETWLYDFSIDSFTLRFSNNQWNNGVGNCEITIEYTKTTN